MFAVFVEVDNGGTAANQLTGTISAPRGNVTLTGLMVNQDGRVSATTSVAANGSVILQAADTFPPSGYSNGTPFYATHGGTVARFAMYPRGECHRYRRTRRSNTTPNGQFQAPVAASR